MEEWCDKKTNKQILATSHRRILSKEKVRYKSIARTEFFSPLQFIIQALLDWKFTSGSIMTQHYVSLYIKDLEKVNTLSAVRAQLTIIDAPVLSWLVDSNNVYSKSLNAIEADHCLCFNRAAREGEEFFEISIENANTGRIFSVIISKIHGDI